MRITGAVTPHKAKEEKRKKEETASSLELSLFLSERLSSLPLILPTASPNPMVSPNPNRATRCPSSGYVPSVRARRG